MVSLPLKHLLRDPLTAVRFPLYCPIVAMILVGCTAKAPVSGLKPEYPPAVPVVNEWMKVNSLQPTFRWQAFPHRRDLIEDSAELKDRITDVTYELKIWRALRDSPGALVYSRHGLLAPLHQVEIPLEPSTKYYWSVRARFRLDGYLRGTEWSTLILLGPGAKDPAADLWYSDLSNVSYFFAFKTPSN